MKRKILITADHIFPYPKAGGGRSLIAFAEKLSKKHNVTVITPHQKNLKINKKSYKLIVIKSPFYLKFLRSFPRTNLKNLWWNKFLKRFLKENKYDILMAHTFILPSVKGLDIKKILFVRGGLHFSPSVESINLKKPLNKRGYFKNLDFIFKIQYPFLAHFRKRSIETLREADFLISNSQYVANINKVHTGKDSFIIYVEVKIDKYKTKMDKSPRYILFINPTLSKGVDIMYQIAKRLPERDFLVVGKTDLLGKKYYSKLISLPNVKSLGSVDNMKKIYKKTRLYVHPTRYPEGIGRTCTESMINGIPCIISDRGGLLEGFKGAADIINSIEDIKQWTNAIRKYDNKKYHKTKSFKCKQRAKYLSKKHTKQYKNFLKLLEKL